jgi:predicted O-methyltransferase YrrM
MTDAAADTSYHLIRRAAEQAQNRFELWATLLNRIDAREVAELGVYRGAFAAHILASCPAIATYYMIDPWRHLEEWNKPANRDDAAFERVFRQAMHDTRDHERRRVVLRGRTTEVIDRIPDGALDFAYVDGDHTLRGITADLVRVYPKVRDGGWIGGDDFARSIWQHGAQFEPTLVFPFAVYFAEAVGSRIFGLPHRQFLIEKRAANDFQFADLTGTYGSLDLLTQLPPRGATPGREPGPAGGGKPGLVRRVLHRVRR